jgi:hypothetical protein
LISVLIVNKYAVHRYRVTATGNSSIAFDYKYILRATTVGEIVRDTCDTIWEYLKLADMSDAKMTGYAQKVNSTSRQIFRTAWALLMESTLG